VCKTTVLLTKNMDDCKRANAVYSEFFAVDPPARAAFAVAALPAGALVEIEAVVTLGSRPPAKL